jgi:hypothetical protein
MTKPQNENATFHGKAAFFCTVLKTGTGTDQNGKVLETAFSATGGFSAWLDMPLTLCTVAQSAFLAF